MDLGFAIIPFERSNYSSAKDFVNKLTNHIVTYIDIKIDNDFDTPFSVRMNKWRRDEYNVIIINDDYFETNSISIRYNDSFNEPENIGIDVFIELVSNFEYNHNDNTNNTDSNLQIRSEPPNPQVNAGPWKLNKIETDFMRPQTSCTIS